MLRFLPVRSPMESGDVSPDVRYVLSFAGEQPIEKTPPQAIVGWLAGDVSELEVDTTKKAVFSDPARFQENEKFRAFLHDFLAHHVDKSPSLQKKAKQYRGGWMNINDQRSRFGRAVPSEDIFGTVELRDGEMIPLSYTPMPTHRLLTDEGLFRLDGFLQKQLEQSILALIHRARSYQLEGPTSRTK